MVLYEYFNTTNQTSPHVERHENFVNPIKKPSCAIVETLAGKDRCAFVSNHSECLNQVQFINYIKMYYCTFDTTENLWSLLGIAVLIIIIFYYFWILAMLSNSYFCPALQTLAKILHLNENVAGVTLLAFGNAAPDFFSSIAGIYSESRNSYSDTYSANLFVNLVVAGSIIVMNPFVVEPEFFLRDISFLLLDVVYMDYTIKTSSHKVSIAQAFGVPVIYLSYIFVVVMDHWLLLKKKKGLERLMAKSGGEMSVANDLKRINSVVALTTLAKTSKDRVDYATPNTNLFQQFFQSIKPFNVAEFRKRSHFGKILAILKVPITFFLSILIPYVDYSAPNYGWSKLLCCLQFVVTPAFIAIGLLRTWFPKVIPIVILLASPLMVVAFLFSRTDRNPSYYKFISILSALATTMVIYAVAAESLVLLEVLGITLHCSDALIGSTLLPWGNSIGDLVANIALSKQGYPRMAYAACFGAPVFNSVCCIGIPLLIKSFSSDSGYTELTEGTLGENASIFLIIGLFSAIIYGLTNNFMLRRSCGIFNILLYGIYLVHAFLSEFGIIHPYGTDHTLDRRVENLE